MGWTEGLTDDLSAIVLYSEHVFCLLFAKGFSRIEQGLRRRLQSEGGVGKDECVAV